MLDSSSHFEIFTDTMDVNVFAWNKYQLITELTYPTVSIFVNVHLKRQFCIYHLTASYKFTGGRVYIFYYIEKFSPLLLATWAFDKSAKS